MSTNSLRSERSCPISDHQLGWHNRSCFAYLEPSIDLSTIMLLRERLLMAIIYSLAHIPTRVWPWWLGGLGWQTSPWVSSWETIFATCLQRALPQEQVQNSELLRQLICSWHVPICLTNCVRAEVGFLSEAMQALCLKQSAFVLHHLEQTRKHCIERTVAKLYTTAWHSNIPFISWKRPSNGMSFTILCERSREEALRSLKDQNGAQIDQEHMSVRLLTRPV